MRKQILLLAASVGFTAGLQGQVGINTDSPKATLDVVARNTDGSKPEGLIAPRLTKDVLVAASGTGQYGTLQNGAIVYVTDAVAGGSSTGQTAYVDAPGYYYFDGVSNQWKKMGERSNIYNADGTLSNPRIMTMDGNTLGFVGGRVGIGSSASHPSAILGLESTTLGFLPPRMTKAQMDAIVNPSVGLMIYCTDFAGDQGCLMINDSSVETSPKWASLCSSNVSSPIVMSIDCSSAVTSGNLYSGVTASGVTTTIPYNGGNGGAYQAVNFYSTGVQGLVASLPAGALNTGNGSFVFNIIGTPNGTGTANFDITIAGKQCSFSIPVTTLAASVGSLTCGSVVFSPATLTQWAAYSGTLTVPYTGGNGGAYPSSSFTVNGLTFTRPAGTLATGNGNFVYNVSGTPTASGTMSVPVSFGTVSCNVTKAVQAPAGAVTGLTCGSASFSPATLTQWIAYNGTLTVPYTGGNGGAYSSSSFTVNGLTFTRPAGTLAAGNGSLMYNVSGTPTASGTMSVPVSLGTASCNVSKTVTIGTTVVMPGNSQAWMRHNLGADTSLNPDTPIVIGLHGNYYQWGRKAAVANASTSAAAISGWNTTDAPPSSWSDTSKTANDPCPAGFRVPTRQQWINLVNNTTKSNTGSWTNSATNYGTALILTASGGQKLTFPAAGYRSNMNGSLAARGAFGAYWSSTFDSSASVHAHSMNFDSDSVSSSISQVRSGGYSIRCISE
ncbi:FISUMP domain-containing protein [Chryseobacterium gossypii]|uniref:FISUMP domain-containing protein n=1 Tax=Chryseobacterium gossypii TaxID=3231602 RepID=UPI003525727E